MEMDLWFERDVKSAGLKKGRRKGIRATPPVGGGVRLYGVYSEKKVLRQEPPGKAVDVDTDASGHDRTRQRYYAISVIERHGRRIESGHRLGQLRRARPRAVRCAVPGDEMVNHHGFSDLSDAFKKPRRVLDGEQWRDGNHDMESPRMEPSGGLKAPFHGTRQRRESRQPVPVPFNGNVKP